MRLRRFSSLAVLSFLMLAASVAAVEEGGRVEPVGEVLQAEFALQSGDLAGGAQAYLRAARGSADPAVAERATRVGLLAGQREVARGALDRWRELAPEAPILRAQAVALALMEGEHESAMEQARALLALPGEDGWPLLLRSLSDARGDAEIIARSVVVALTDELAFPPSIKPWLAFAGLARRLNDPRTSARLVDLTLERFPDDPSVSLLRASRLRERGDIVGATAALSALLENGDALPAPLRRTAATELAVYGEPVAAARLLGKGKPDPADFALRAGWLIAANALPEIRSLYQEVEAQATSVVPSRALLLGHLAEALKQWSVAQGWYQSVVEPSGREIAQLRLGYVLGRQAKVSEAMSVFRELQASEDADGERVREAFLMEADLQSRQGSDVATLDAYRRGLAIFEGDPALLYARSLHHERQDRVPEALADLRQIIDADPDHAEALNAYGYTLADRLSRYSEALPMIEKANRLKPNSPAILDSLGWVTYRLGRAPEALGLLERAWKGEKDPEIAAHLGEVLWISGRRDEARAIWQQGRALDPTNRALVAALAKFRP